VKYILIFIYILLLVSNVFALDDFIRGTWNSLTAVSTLENWRCVPGMTAYDSFQVNWNQEEFLARIMNVNLVGASPFVTLFRDSVMLETNEIKAMVGQQSTILSRNYDYWTACRWEYYQQSWWSPGVETAAEYWDSLFYGQEDDVFTHLIAHEINRPNDDSSVAYTKYACLAATDAIVKDVNASIATSVVDGYGFPVLSDFPDSVPNLDIYMYDHYPYTWISNTTNTYVSGDGFQESIIDNRVLENYDSVYSVFTEAYPWLACIQTNARFVNNSSDTLPEICQCIQDTAGT